jgi:hypothetical protein
MTVKERIEFVVEKLIMLLIAVIMAFLLWFMLSSIVLPARIGLVTYMAVMGTFAFKAIYRKWPWQ